ncbi:type II secretion system protein [Anabaena sp. FACHB-1237]|nr:type II secretion system protein [Anabaena sp. FACHB-1237]
MLKIKQYFSINNAGFTIIESVVSMITLAILLSAISPVFVLSAAMRVQAKRMEKATQVADTFIDGVRDNSITPPGKLIELQPANKNTPTNLDDNLITITEMPVPNQNSVSNINKDFYLSKQDATICLVGNNCTRDPENSIDEFYIQAAQIKVTNSRSTAGYRLAIRIYRADIDLSKTVLTSMDTDNNNNTYSLLGNKQMPIIERIVDITDINTTFQDLCSRLGIALQQQDCPQ